MAAEINIGKFKLKTVIGSNNNINNIINQFGIIISINLSLIWDDFSYLNNKFLAIIKFNTKIIIQLAIITEGIKVKILSLIIKSFLVNACKFLWNAFENSSIFFE